MKIRVLGGLGVVLSLACGVGKGDVDHGSCPDYIACAAATGTPTATIEATYGTDGLCWEEEDEALCRAACEDAMTVLASTYPGEATCSPEGVPQTSDWGVDDCRFSVVPSGSGVGSVPPNFELLDQNGDTVTLYDFCDRALLLVSDVAWHRAIADHTDDIQDLLDAHEGRFAVAFLLFEGNDYDDPGADDLDMYAGFLPFDAPVLADPAAEVFSDFSSEEVLPTFVLFAPGSVLFEERSRTAIEAATVEEALR